MKSRRELLQKLAILSASLWAYPTSSFSQETKYAGLDLFVPSGVGGGWDGLARAFAQVAREAGLIGNATIENVGGAGGTLGLTRYVNQHRGRNNSMIVSGSSMIGAVIANKTSLGLTDLVPVARMTQEAGAILVGASSRYKTIGDLVDALKTNPSLPIGGGSAGGIDHITLGLLLKTIGVDPARANYVAFSSKGLVIPAVVENQIHALISGYSEYSAQIKAGQLRVLATSGPEPLPESGVGTLREQGLDIAVVNWRGLFAPPGTPEDTAKKLIDLVRSVHKLPAWKKTLENRQWEDAFLTGDLFNLFIKSNTASMNAALKAIGLA